jgi:hypothetical protein
MFGDFGYKLFVVFSKNLPDDLLTLLYIYIYSVCFYNGFREASERVLEGSDEDLGVEIGEFRTTSLRGFFSRQLNNSHSPHR